jgi:hypothetical protein
MAFRPHPADGPPAALYLPPATFDAVALSEDAQVAVATGSAAVLLSASRLTGPRAAACVDAGAASLPPGAGPTIGDVGGEPAWPGRGTALGWHLRMRELADGSGAGGGAGGAGGEADAGDDAAGGGTGCPSSAPPVRGLAWSPAGAAPGGGCLLVLMAGGDQVRERGGRVFFLTPNLAGRPSPRH